MVCLGRMGNRQITPMNLDVDECLPSDGERLDLAATQLSDQFVDDNTGAAQSGIIRDPSGSVIPKPIKIEYHPHSGTPEAIISLYDYNKSTEEPKPPVDFEPWRPFATCADYEYAEIALEAGLTIKQNNVLLKLIDRIAKGEARLTLKNNFDLEKAWERASEKLTRVSLDCKATEEAFTNVRCNEPVQTRKIQCQV